MKSPLQLISLIALLCGLPGIATKDCNCTPCKTINKETGIEIWSLMPGSDAQWKCPGTCLYKDTNGDERCFCDPGDMDYTTICAGKESYRV